ncbi:unnamed protein product [Calicophoron daubneyi]|uniref:Uncharacterized protein n=1 Tax=Calicophoron daubneyi TaxID=300641 RepID=A0AAV2TI94_CALDB
MLKSLLFHQNRTGEIPNWCGNCTISSSSQCTKRRSIQSVPIRVHAAVSHQDRRLIKSLLINAKMTAVEWTLYEFADYLPLVAFVHNTHGSGPTALLKLMWPFMLSLEAEMLICQIFGRKQVHSLNAVPVRDEKNRASQEALTLFRIINTITSFPRIPTPTQRDYLPLFSSLKSCEWHVQICCGGLKEDCPVVWPEWKPNGGTCNHFDHVGTVEKPKILLLAHYNTGSKPENGDWTMRYHDPPERILLLNESLNKGWEIYGMIFATTTNTASSN